jgi:hypothetical protein
MHNSSYCPFVFPYGSVVGVSEINELGGQTTNLSDQVQLTTAQNMSESKLKIDLRTRISQVHLVTYADTFFERQVNVSIVVCNSALFRESLSLNYKFMVEEGVTTQQLPI